MTKILPTMAVYRNKDYKKEISEISLTEGEANLKNPVSWVLQYPSGNIGMTYTVPAFRRKGFSKASNIAIMQALKKENRNSYIAILHGNDDSVKFHEKIGYRKFTETCWCFYLPPGVEKNDIMKCVDQ